METKTHVFSENLVPDGEARSWSYGRHKALTFEQVEAIIKLLPSEAKIIQVHFEEPENYQYPEETKN